MAELAKVRSDLAELANHGKTSRMAHMADLTGSTARFQVTIRAVLLLEFKKSEMLNLPKMSISLFRRNTLLLNVLRHRFAQDAHFACVSTSQRKVRYCPLLSSSPAAVSLSANKR